MVLLIFQGESLKVSLAVPFLTQSPLYLKSPSPFWSLKVHGYLSVEAEKQTS